jgi:hypothetical protein
MCPVELVPRPHIPSLLNRLSQQLERQVSEAESIPNAIRLQAPGVIRVSQHSGIILKLIIAEHCDEANWLHLRRVFLMTAKVSIPTGALSNI